MKRAITDAMTAVQQNSIDDTRFSSKNRALHCIARRKAEYYRRMKLSKRLLMVAAGLAGFAAAQVSNAGGVPTDGDLRSFYESRVRPILEANCFKCHGGEK